MGPKNIIFEWNEIKLNDVTWYDVMVGHPRVTTLKISTF